MNSLPRKPRPGARCPSVSHAGNRGSGQKRLSQWLSLSQPHWELTQTPLLPLLGPHIAESGSSFRARGMDTPHLLAQEGSPIHLRSLTQPRPEHGSHHKLRPLEEGSQRHQGLEELCIQQASVIILYLKQSKGGQAPGQRHPPASSGRPCRETLARLARAGSFR